jgi:hypothetical protein
MIRMKSRCTSPALLSLLPGGILHAAPVKVIFDTDTETDCDDAGAMAVLHSLADRGECEILATVIGDSWVEDDGEWAARGGEGEKLQ